MGKETVAVKLEPETIEDVEAYMDEHDIETRSEGIRQLINAGLKHPSKKEQLKGAASMSVPFASFALVLGMTGGTMRFTTGGGLAFTVIGGLLCLYAYYNC